MRLPFPRQSTAQGAPAAPQWVGSAYGAAADQLLDGLPELMARAAKEARSPRTPPSPMQAAPTPDAGELLEALTQLRALTLSAAVAGEDVARDERLRAAMSVAIGAAHGLALASSSQPTAGDLAQSWAGVNALLVAAGRRGLTP